MDSSYVEKILSTCPDGLIGYWPGSERLGATLYDYSRYNHAGVISNMTLNAPGIGDGLTALVGSGASYANVYSANLRKRFNGALGTVLAWVQVPEAVWTDNLQHNALRFAAGDPNHATLFKTIGGALGMQYTAGGVARSISKVLTRTDWLCLALTWDKATNQVKGFFDGAQENTAQVSLGAWSGLLAPTTAVIGAANTTPATSWCGGLAHIALWNTALPDSAIARLSYTGGVLIVGDSKTNGNLWPDLLVSGLRTAQGKPLGIVSRTFGIGGATVASMRAYLNENLGDVSGPLALAIINLGVNDVSGVLVEATWKAQLMHLLDLLRATSPAIDIYIALPWKVGYTTQCAMLAGWIRDVIALYPGGVHEGPDENVWLPPVADTILFDGTHYKLDAGTQAVVAAQWLTALGY